VAGTADPGGVGRASGRSRIAWAALGIVAVGGLAWATAPVGGSAASPDARASVAPAEVPVVVTMQVVDETFRVLLTQPDDVAIAWALLGGDEVPSIPNGRIVYGDGGVNAPWTWQLDPDDFEWADMTTEGCDGKPSDVELHLITSDRYCPWLAPVLAVVPASAFGSPAPSGAPDASRPPVAPFPVFRDTMAAAWASLDELRASVADEQDEGLARIALEGPAVADALESGLGSVLPDICYMDAWRLQWLVAVDLRLVADLWSGGQDLYAAKAAERLRVDLASADEALGTIGCD
jgi:hypothetical protein